MYCTLTLNRYYIITILNLFKLISLYLENIVIIDIMI